MQLSEDEYIDAYSLVCDVIERNYQNIPDDEPFMHTSKEARAAATTVFAILGVIQKGGEQG